MAKFYTIDGIDDDNLPLDPGVLRFYDRQSAEGFLEVMRRITDELSACFVAEHEDAS